MASCRARTLFAISPAAPSTIAERNAALRGTLLKTNNLEQLPVVFRPDSRRRGRSAEYRSYSIRQSRLQNRKLLRQYAGNTRMSSSKAARLPQSAARDPVARSGPQVAITRPTTAPTANNRCRKLSSPCSRRSTRSHQRLQRHTNPPNPSRPEFPFPAIVPLLAW